LDYSSGLTLNPYDWGYFLLLVPFVLYVISIFFRLYDMYVAWLVVRVALIVIAMVGSIIAFVRMYANPPVTLTEFWPTVAILIER
jgi:hypothetical protein